jgi:hypothetical protein
MHSKYGNLILLPLDKQLEIANNSGKNKHKIAISTIEL